jgi:hypothetical protein
VIDLAGAMSRRVGPMVQPPLADAVEDISKRMLGSQHHAISEKDVAFNITAQARAWRPAGFHNQ